MEDPKAKFREAFRAASEKKDAYTLTGDMLIVEIIPADEMNSRGGLIIAEDARQTKGLSALRPVFARVLMVGEGYYGDGGESIPVEADPGDIILVGKNSVAEMSDFGKLPTYGKLEIGVVRASEILMRFKGQEGFDEFFGTALKVVS